MSFFKRNLDLLKKLEAYLDIAAQTMDFYRQAINYSLKKGIDEHFEVLARKTHHDESNADDLRRLIEFEMYEKSLLPESQEDLFGIIERADKIPNMAETVLNTMLMQKTEILHPIRKDVQELVDLSLETFAYTREATLNCFGKMEKIKELARLVDNNESLGDRLEKKIITKIFEEKINTGEKILQKELVLQIGSICDLCEYVIDSLVITSIKRRL